MHKHRFPLYEDIVLCLSGAVFQPRTKVAVLKGCIAIIRLEAVCGSASREVFCRVLQIPKPISTLVLAQRNSDMGISAWENSDPGFTLQSTFFPCDFDSTMNIATFCFRLGDV